LDRWLFLFKSLPAQLILDINYIFFTMESSEKNIN
jgi:hypothetical protein